MIAYATIAAFEAAEKGHAVKPVGVFLGASLVLSTGLFWCPVHSQILEVTMA